LTRRLIDHTSAIVHAIEPAPGFDQASLSPDQARLLLYEDRSLSALSALPPVDVAILDGDPNWYTVTNELRLLAGVDGSDTPPVIMVHHIGWPFGRRDGYYDPDAIPQAHRSAHAALGLVPGHAAPSADGLALVPFVGLHEHRAHVGVRTAVDDFLAQQPDTWRLVELPGLHGVAILAPRSRLTDNPALAEALDGFERREFLLTHVNRVEHARIEALLRPSSGRVAVSGTTNGHSPQDQARQATAPPPVVAAQPPLERAPEDSSDSIPEPLDDAGEDHLDAAQVRLELLESDRDARLRETTARLGAIKEERATLVRDAALATAALAAAQRELERSDGDVRAARRRGQELERASAQATARVGQLEREMAREREASSAAQAQAADSAEGLEAVRRETDQTRARLQGDIDALMQERRVIEEYVRRAAESHSWRAGHRLASFGRLLTVRRSRGTSALTQVQDLLAQSPPALPSGDPASPALDAGAKAGIAADAAD
jgi:hypothetical protein